MNFNLVHDPWIQAFYTDGQIRKIGILQALQDAGKIKDIIAGNPMDKASIIRFLITIVYWHHGNPSSDFDPLPSDWEGLEKEAHHFNLFGDKRFFQIKKPNRHREKKDRYAIILDEEGNPEPTKERSPSVLISEIASGSNQSHFCQWYVEGEGFSLAACAMALVRMVSFMPQGGSGNLQAIHGDPCVHRLLVGKTLADTLSLTWRKRKDLKGKPSWINPAQVHKYTNIDFFLGMTWVPRYVWLIEPTDNGVCMLTGEYGPIVRKCYHYKRIDMLLHNFDSEKKPKVVWDDPTIVLKDVAILYDTEDKKRKRKAKNKKLEPDLSLIRFDKFGDAPDLDVEISILKIISKGALHHPNYLHERAVGELWIIPTGKQSKVFGCREFMMTSRNEELIKSAEKMTWRKNVSEMNRIVSSSIVEANGKGIADEQSIGETVKKKQFASRHYMLKPTAS